jgi:hypothetical protein
VSRGRSDAYSTQPLGHLRRFDRGPATSGIPSETDILKAGRDVSNAPISDVEQRNRASFGDRTMVWVRTAEIVLDKAVVTNGSETATCAHG